MEWTRGVADQLAQEGFLAVAPDFLSGMGPNGGGQEAFEFPDDIVKAMGRLKDDESMRRMKAAREYILKMPMANGQLAAMGFCWGGEMAFLLAAEAPDLKAAVVYYGGAPEATEMAKIKAPILGFYGTDDVRLTSTIGPAAAEMKKLGKTFETHIYEHATHAFLYMQGLADNNKATADSWPKAIALLKKSMS
jgi:carboxymethylenebutenolidase